MELSSLAQRGWIKGEQWAIGLADFRDLERLDAGWRRLFRDREEHDAIRRSTDGAYVRSRVLEMIWGHEVDESSVKTFWGNFGTDEETLNPEFVVGFVRGALAAYDKTCRST